MNVIVEAIWLILPAYIANSSAVLLGGGKPIDFGKTWRGKPIFGAGKTWRGFIGGGICGMAVGIIMNQLWQSFGVGLNAVFVLLSLSFGALAGDLIKSFFKRRIGKKRGEKWLVIDQIDFLLGAFFFTFIFNREWFVSNFSLYHIIFLLIFTPLLHLATNIIAYVLKLKKVPW
ncbi:MAG: CDP-2,3-bis-(O-geranylgeranyl)-sn-glycerol synthase [Thermoplasmata archaeon]|nr:MAG: CDP-2,3-bis-(O-geranylgeranyl)-sn-glycerol synthase [Thermoplasmata archaeon]